ncbi:MAG: cytochrome c oxidase subunit II [Bdellovibrionota bacterium]
MNEPYGWWLPINISANGAPIDQLITTLHWFMVLLFTGWGIFYLYCLFRFRARPGHQADATPKHFRLPTYLEVGVAIFEVFLLVFISYPIWSKVKNEMPSDEEALVVRVTAEQFAWNIHYPGKDGIFGQTSPDLISPEDNNPIGLDRENDPNAKDDIISINVMHFPVNKKVKVYLSSKDVIHSFGIPVMRVKQDAIPGTVVPVWFEANKTGKFEIMCAQLCGVGHTRMRGEIHVDTDEEFQKWLQDEAQYLEEYSDAGQREDENDV